MVTKYAIKINGKYVTENQERGGGDYPDIILSDELRAFTPLFPTGYYADRYLNRHTATLFWEENGKQSKAPCLSDVYNPQTKEEEDIIIRTTEFVPVYVYEMNEKRTR